MKLKDIKIGMPYQHISDIGKSFIIFIDNNIETPRVIEHNAAINSMARYRFTNYNEKIIGKNSELDYNYTEFEDKRYVVRKLFELRAKMLASDWK